MTSSPTFLKAFLKALAFMLLCGAVGPAFLIIYFVLGDEGPTWMLWNGIAWTAIDVIAAYAFARFSVNNAARTAVLRTSGVPGLGRILGVRETGTEINGRRVVEFTVRVTGPRVAEFTTRITTPMPVTGAAAIAKGVVGVFVADSGTKATIDWEATALYTGSMPATFESTSDGRVYDLTGDAEALVEVVDILRRNGIALDSMVDVRADPVVRDEVMAVVRRHSDDDHPSQFTDVAAGTRTLTERLTELDMLFAGGRITRDEYDRLRTKVVDSA